MDSFKRVGASDTDTVTVSLAVTARGRASPMTGNTNNNSGMTPGWRLAEKVQLRVSGSGQPGTRVLDPHKWLHTLSMSL